MTSQISITLLLIIITGVISYQAFENQHMKGRLLFVPDLIRRTGQYDRFLTSGFIHGDWMHLIFNMFVLYSFGELIEAYYGLVFGEILGRTLYLFMYLSAIVVSSIPSYIKHQDNRMYAALGASGAVSGVLFSLIFFDPWSGITFLFFPFFSFPVIVVGVLYLWYSDYMSKHGRDNIGHDAHFYGALYGFSFTLILGFLLNQHSITHFFERLTNPSGF